MNTVVRLWIMIIAGIILIYEFLKKFIPVDTDKSNINTKSSAPKSEKQYSTEEKEEGEYVGREEMGTILIPKTKRKDIWKQSVKTWRYRNGKTIRGYIVKDVLSHVTYSEKTKNKIVITPVYDEDMVRNSNQKVAILNGVTKHRFPGPDNLNIIEGICKMSLEYYLGVPFNKVKHDQIVNPLTNRKLELDLFNSEIEITIEGKKYKGLALEYQGPTHYYFPNQYQKGEDGREAFKMAAQRDVFKKERCEELGIRLLEVPCVIANQKVPLFIFNSLERDGYIFSPPVLEEDIYCEEDFI